MNNEISVAQLLAGLGMNADGTCPDPPGSTMSVGGLLGLYGISGNRDLDCHRPPG